MQNILLFIIEHIKIVELIVFWYPVCMGLLWIIGGVLYYFRIERKDPLPLPYTPLVSVIVPAYNESDNLENVIEKLNDLNYPDYEILIVNDGSKDNTAEIAERLTEQYERVRFVNLQENNGKANALYLGFIASRGEYLVCVDGDSYLDKDCIRYLMSHFLNTNNGERVGAVTGNPRVRNRTSLFAKIQLCEYASIISLIKRTQRIWGKVMTVSGVVVAYRKQALLDCGLWDRDMITEDIGVTWKLEKNFWDIRYEPNALCWMLVPETLKGLVKQRKRWAQGGQEVMIRHAGIFKSWRRRRLYPIYFEQVMSLLWIILWALLTIVEILKLCYGVGDYMPYLWKTQYLAFICLLQFVVALCLEKKYDKDIFKYMIAAAWYPLCYWAVSGIVALMALPGTLASRKGKLATWKSPDRGINTAVKNSDNPDAKNVAEAKTEDDCERNQKLQCASIQQTSKGDEIQQDSKNQNDDIFVSRQKTWKKILEILATTLAWAFILIYVGYVIYGAIAILLHKPLFEIWIYNYQMLCETKKLLFITLIVLLIEIVVMIFWKEYNRKKYGKLNRRKFKPDASIEQIAEFFNVNQEVVETLQSMKVVTLGHNFISKEFKAERKELFGYKLVEKEK